MEFRAADVVRILDIKRTRLQQWLERNYITPSEPADGPGTRNIYSLSDLYGLALFERLVKMGVIREKAGELAGHTNWEAVKKGGKKYAVVRVKALMDDRKKSMVLGETFFSEDPPKVNLIDTEDDIVWVVNLKKIFDYVDSRI